jgi:hypothetical protein
VLDATWLRDVQNVEHTKFQNRKVVVRDQGGLCKHSVKFIAGKIWPLSHMGYQVFIENIHPTLTAIGCVIGGV